MHCLTVLYPQPDNPTQFKAYYADMHLPLARQLPGLTSHTVAYPAALGDPGSAPFCVFQGWFASGEAMGQALQSGIGARVAADAPNYSPNGATLFHYAVEG